MKATFACVFPLWIALYYPGCTPKVQPTMPPGDALLAEFWKQPGDLAGRDLFHGPWGRDPAPDPAATYTFVARKHQGTNPPGTVLDPAGREWHANTPPPTDPQA